MRISEVRIGSFGKLKDVTYRSGPGLNVFYGPNESGKSTTMEFIRSALVPSNKRNQYPERAKTDSGTVVIDDDGVTREIGLERNDRIGDVPQCLSSMDPGLYRLVFAMNPSDLDNLEAISSSDIRSRFLTIPGGESMPEVIRSIEDDISELVGKVSTSPSRLNGLQKEEDALFGRIGGLRQSAESYSDITSRIESLTVELADLERRNAEAEENNRLFDRAESQRAAFKSLSDYKARRTEIMLGSVLREETIEEHDVLRSDAVERRSAFDAMDSSRNELISGFPGGDDGKVRSNLSRISSVVSRRGEYDSHKNRSFAPVRYSMGVRIGVAAVLAAAAAGLLLFPGLETVVRVAGAAASLAVMAGFLYATRDRQASEKEQNEIWIQAYEAEVVSTAAACGYEHLTVYSDLDALAEAISRIAALDSMKDRWMKAQMDSVKAENRYLSFLAEYKGEEGYQKALENTRELDSVNASIDALSFSIRNSGFDPNKPFPDVVKEEVDRSREAELRSEIAALTERANHVIDTAELDSLIDRSYVLRSEKEKVLRRGAVSLLSSAIVQSACSELYENVHPSVITTTDRYLDLMTCGSCRMDIDPRRTELTVISDGVPKGPKQWSSGLRAQVLLSLKLAIAKEMGSGKVPVILDDVLLPFDRERKEGACRALAALSEDMQVLLFTCDDRIEETAKGLDNTDIIHISR